MIRGEGKALTAGLTEKKIQQLAGVSRSSVQRWKRGTKLAPETESKILDVVIRERQKQIAKNYREEVEYYQEKGELEASPFLEHIRRRKEGFVFVDKDATLEQKRKTLAQETYLQGLKSSTVAGIEEIKKNRKTAAMDTFGVKDEEQLDDITDIYGMLMDNRALRDELFDTYHIQRKTTLSKQIQELIKKITNHGRVKGLLNKWDRVRQQAEENIANRNRQTGIDEEEALW